MEEPQALGRCWKEEAVSSQPASLSESLMEGVAYIRRPILDGEEAVGRTPQGHGGLGVCKVRGCNRHGAFSEQLGPQASAHSQECCRAGEGAEGESLAQRPRETLTICLLSC